MELKRKLTGFPEYYNQNRAHLSLEQGLAG